MNREIIKHESEVLRAQFPDIDYFELDESRGGRGAIAILDGRFDLKELRAFVAALELLNE